MHINVAHSPGIRLSTYFSVTFLAWRLVTLSEFGGECQWVAHAPPRGVTSVSKCSQTN